jgi:hypothetical protein
MYTNGIGKRQRHWTPAFAGVTLFEVIALELFSVITFLFGLKAFLFGPITLKLSSRRRPGSSVFRISSVNA